MNPLQLERSALTVRVDRKSADVEELCNGALRERHLADVIHRDRLNVFARIAVSYDHASRR
jgi:hypothetical protein